MVWPWINATLFQLTGNYLNQPFSPARGSGERWGALRASGSGGASRRSLCILQLIRPLIVSTPASAVIGDPLVRGFNGTQFHTTQAPGTVLQVLTTRQYALTATLVPAPPKVRVCM